MVYEPLYHALKNGNCARKVGSREDEVCEDQKRFF